MAYKASVKKPVTKKKTEEVKAPKEPETVEVPKQGLSIDDLIGGPVTEEIAPQHIFGQTMPLSRLLLE